MRSFSSVRPARKWGSLPGTLALARQAGLVFSGSVAVVLLVGLTGCASRLPEKSSLAPGTTAQLRAASPAASLSVPESVPEDLQASSVPESVTPTRVAVEAVDRFCRPTLSEPQWIAGLSPLLTLEAASVYGTVDPARVQCSRVVPPAREDEGDGFTQIVTVPTDGLQYRVVLARASLAAPWLVFRITPASEK